MMTYDDCTQMIAATATTRLTTTTATTAMALGAAGTMAEAGDPLADTTAAGPLPEVRWRHFVSASHRID